MINEFENYLDIIELHKKIEFKTLFLEITNVCNGVQREHYKN